jgi:hypothetical protein
MNPEEFERLVQETINRLAYNGPLNIPPEQLIRAAGEGVPEAHEALCQLALKLTQEGKPLPWQLQRYIVSVAAASRLSKPRGGDKGANRIRDIYILATLRHLERKGIKPTRNEATDAPSGCSIVAEALKRGGAALSEQAVAKIWQARPVRNE